MTTDVPERIRRTVAAARLLHYGHLNGGALQPVRFRDPRRVCGRVKPEGEGIIWCSPEGSEFGWREWCLSEMSSWLDLPLWQIDLAPSARVYLIDSLADLGALVEQFHNRVMDTDAARYCRAPISWPRVAEHYDAVHLTEKGQWKTRLSEPYNLYGWDCESVVILNTDAVAAVTLRALAQHLDGVLPPL